MVSNILLFLTKKGGKMLYVKYRRLYVLVSCILDHCFLHKSSLMSSMMREKLQRRDALIATRCSLLPLITSYSSQCILTGDVFGLGDLDLWPMTLTFELGLDIFMHESHAKIQVCIHIYLARIVRRKDGQTHTQTHTQTMPKLFHPSLTRGVTM